VSVTSAPASAAPIGQPAAEVVVSVEMVRALLESQHSDLAQESLQLVGAGWDNTIFRLGDRLAVRLPRRKLAEQLLLNEQQWLPRLPSPLPLPIPVPVRTGKPDGEFPWHWSVVPWLDGTTAERSDVRSDQAPVLVEFFDVLHQPMPSEAPTNINRGVPLAHRRAAVEERMERLAQHGLSLSDRLRREWECSVELPIDIAPTWLHGDLHALNVLVKEGRLSGVIDWGDVCQGDRATDLAAIWMIFADQRAREDVMRRCRTVTESTWKRARAWAIGFAVTLSDSGLAGDPSHALVGKRTLERLAEGP
jgi:aminoglycoside phosphotransferase (APT) family kinase protein